MNLLAQEGALRQVGVISTALYSEPSQSSDLETELLFGEQVEILVHHNGWTKVRATLDAYEGYVRQDSLIAPAPPTHRICRPSTPVYWRPSFKSLREDTVLHMNSRIEVIDTRRTSEGVMCRIEGLGWVFGDDLVGIAHRAPDFVDECLKFLNMRYGWGARTTTIDCSALLQAGCIAAGIDCLRNVSQQVETLGEALPLDPFPELRRGDLVFWTEGKGRHVAIMVNAQHAVHATIKAPYRGVVVQELRRIASDQSKAGNGPMTVVRRFPNYRPA